MNRGRRPAKGAAFRALPSATAMSFGVHKADMVRALRTALLAIRQLSPGGRA